MSAPLKPDTARRFMRLAEHQITQLALFGSVDAALKVDGRMMTNPHPSPIRFVE